MKDVFACVAAQYCPALFREREMMRCCVRLVLPLLTVYTQTQIAAVQWGGCLPARAYNHRQISGFNASTHERALMLVFRQRLPDLCMPRLALLEQLPYVAAHLQAG